MEYLMSEMSSDGRVYVANCVADPDADGPRLAYADWLAGEGWNEQAELIRLQVDVAAGRVAGEGFLAAFLKAKDLATDARAALASTVEPVGCDASFRRGLPEQLTVLPEADLGPGLARVCAELPVLALEVERVDDLPAVAASLSPEIPGRLRELTWYAGYLGEPGDPRADAAPANVSRAVAALAAGLFPRLERLTVRGYPIDASAARALAAAPVFGQLRELTLRRVGLTPTGLSGILERGTPGPLRVLNLSDNPLGDAGAEALAEASGPSGLRTLDLQRTGLGPRGAAALAAAPALATLSRLYMRENDLGPDGARHLARSPHLDRGLALFLAGNRAGAVGKALRQRFRFVSMKD